MILTYDASNNTIFLDLGYFSCILIFLYELGDTKVRLNSSTNWLARRAFYLTFTAIPTPSAEYLCIRFHRIVEAAFQLSLHNAAAN
jgi:hypothetical protein